MDRHCTRCGLGLAAEQSNSQCPRCLDAVWRNTHRDFRGGRGFERTILVLRQGGTCLVSLYGLTDEEIDRKLPKAKEVSP